MTVGGGFATPFLLATGRDAQIVLFTYDAILVAGTMYLAHRRAWPSLHLVSYLATGLTWLAWASRFYTPDKFLPTEIFLTLFVGMFLYILYESRRATGALGHVVRVVLMSAPAVYHLASIAVLYDHPVSFFVYVIAASVAGLIAARQLDRSWIRLIAWIAVQAPLVLWVAQHGGALWALALVVVTSILYLAFGRSISSDVHPPATARYFPTVDTDRTIAWASSAPRCEPEQLRGGATPYPQGWAKTNLCVTWGPR